MQWNLSRTCHIHCINQLKFGIHTTAFGGKLSCSKQQGWSNNNNDTVNTHLMQRGGCRGRCHHTHQCTSQWRTDSAHQLTVFLGCFEGHQLSYSSHTGQSLPHAHFLTCPSQQIHQTPRWMSLTTNNWGRSNVCKSNVRCTGTNTQKQQKKY